MKKLSLFALLIVAGLTLGGCNLFGPSTDIEESSEVSEENIDFTLNLKSFSFTPNALTMKAGETIKVKIESSGGIHDFVVDELGVNSGTVNTGDSKTFEITAPADSAGEYEFYCSVGNHRSQGMVGTIIVE